MYRKIEEEINNPNYKKLISLNGKIEINASALGGITIGVIPVKSLISIKRSNVIIDGSNSELNITIRDTINSNWSLFYISDGVENVEFRNMRININIVNSLNSTRIFSCIYNLSYALKINNCIFNVYCDTQLNLIGVYSNGYMDLNYDYKTDNLVVSNCLIRIESNSNLITYPSKTYGLFICGSNSVSIQNNFIYSNIRGNSKEQLAIGVYTSGRYGRFEGNNIKANAMHVEGIEENQGHATGFINEGMYSLIIGNNIVGEWASRAIGLENRGEFSVINANKILSTHAVVGKTILNTGSKANLSNNIVTTTTKNARLIELKANETIICNNFMEIIPPRSQCNSGCGVYAPDNLIKDNIIFGNIIKNPVTCGILSESNIGLIKDNIVISDEDVVKQSTTENKLLFSKLSVY